MAKKKKVSKKKASSKRKVAARKSSSKKKVVKKKSAVRGKSSAKRKSSSSRSKSSGSSRSKSSASKDLFYWKFPRREFQLLRVEMAVLIVLSGLVFLYMYLQPNLNTFAAVVSVILFVSIYFVVSAVLHKLRKVEEMYELSASHLEIQRYVNGKKTDHHKVPVKKISGHNFDHFFHGAYVTLADGTRHPLFFGSSAESRHVERKVKRYTS